MLKQLNVNLPAQLVRECKHAAIDVDQSLSAFVADALRRHLERLYRDRDESRGQPPATAPARSA
jgi:post-segregation antitoxin (ccd killing protein)